MEPTVREAILWGLVGGLTFLVLAQGYELAAGTGIDALVKAGGAVAVAVVSAALSVRLRRRLPDPNERT